LVNCQQFQFVRLRGIGSIVIDVALSEHTLIEPKLEMGRPINDQFPYLGEAEYASGIGLSPIRGLRRFIAPETLRIICASKQHA
jgi:hypothetical protein